MYKVLLFLAVCFFRVYGQEKIIVYSEAWPPFIYEVNNQVEGPVTDRVKEILALTSIEYDIKLLPWARSYLLARSTPNTLIFSIFHSPERAPFFHWYCPLMKAELGYLYRLSSNNYVIQSLDDVRQYRVGVMREDLTHQYLRDNGFTKHVNLDLSADEYINIKKLISGRVDFIVQSPSAIRYRLQKLGLSEEFVTAELPLLPGSDREHCLALNIDSDHQLVELLNDAFRQWRLASK